MEVHLQQLPSGAILVNQKMLLHNTTSDAPEHALAKWQDDNGRSFYLEPLSTTNELMDTRFQITLPLVEPFHYRNVSASIWRVGGAYLKAKVWTPGVQSEAENIQFVRDNFPQIPVPEVIYSWVDDRTSSVFKITTGMPGETLGDAWNQLTEPNFVISPRRLRTSVAN